MQYSPYCNRICAVIESAANSFFFNSSNEFLAIESADLNTATMVNHLKYVLTSTY